MDGKIHELSARSRDFLYSGRCEDAYKCIKAACSLAGQLYGKEHPHYATTLGNMGWVLHQTNQGGGALHCLEQAKEIFERAGSRSSVDYLLCLNNLAAVYASLGLNDKALATYKSILPQAENLDKLTYATILTNIGSQYRCRHQCTKALEYLKRAMNIYSGEKGGVRGPEYCGVVIHIGRCYAQLKRYKTAIYYFSKVLDLLDERGEENGIYYLAALNNLALAYQCSGEGDIAIEIYSHILKVARSTIGEDHQDIVNVLDNLSDIYIQRNDFTKAIELILAASRINERLIGRSAGLIPATEINHFVNNFRYHIDILFSLLHSLDKPPQHYIDIAFNFTFRRKALIFDLEINERNLTRIGLKKQLKNDFERLKTIKSEIARMNYISSERVQSEIEHSNMLKQLDKEYSSLRRRISYNLPNLREDDTKIVRGSAFVREQLPADTVLIEFLRYTYYDLKLKSKHTPRYVMFFGAYNENIQLFDLGPAQDIDDMILDVINCIELKPEQNYTNFDEQNETLDELNNRLERLNQKLFSNILPEIGSKRHLIIVPDGLLYLLPFGILRNKDRDLIEQYTITYLTSSRDLFSQSLSKPQSQTPPVVIADPDYDLSRKRRSSHSGSLIQDTRYFYENTAPFATLEGTRAEGRVIHQIIGGELWLGKDALKTRFMELTSPKILHIATHGFFQQSHRTPREEWDSLLRSGLVLAGANSYISGQPLPTEAGNGIITAYEISGLDLSSTDLVVLSACETGIGDIIFGEGVYGFRRAFAVSGAWTLVMSLWSIPDEETRDLMITFYSLLKSGKSKSEAMQEAQLELKKRHSHPYFWGAFILQGDANPIQW